uniref:Uncharacterized protein n=1 Tax=Geobacter sp. (strain M21) TaxID=443144 RepID=C6E021_GEOSM
MIGTRHGNGIAMYRRPRPDPLLEGEGGLTEGHGL